MHDYIILWYLCFLNIFRKYKIFIFRFKYIVSNDNTFKISSNVRRIIKETLLKFSFLSWKFITVIHCDKEVAISKELIWSHSYIFVQSAYSPLMATFRGGPSYFYSKNRMLSYKSNCTNSYEIRYKRYICSITSR